MSGRRNTLCEVSNRIAALLVAAFVVGLLSPAAIAGTRNSDATLQGTVASGGNGLAGYQVSLYGSFIQNGQPWVLLGSATSDNLGHFQISYTVDDSWTHDQPVLFVDGPDKNSLVAVAHQLSEGGRRTRIRAQECRVLRHAARLAQV